MIQEAHTAFNRGDYTTALRLYTDLAEQGDATAQTSLAYMYQQGIGTTMDADKARTLYEMAAQKKQPYAMFNLAILYANGLGGVTHDQYKAHELYLEAAIREVPEAMYETALMLERGLGCIQNYSEAAFWYEEGAKRGNLACFNNLGVLYKEGHGVVTDYDRAFICFKRAAEGELAEGQYNLGILYDQGLGVDADHDKALEYCRKAAYNGHEKAKQIIRSLQDDGKIVF
jgi:TPR repeat protein